jgi:hypothetical protein
LWTAPNVQGAARHRAQDLQSVHDAVSGAADRKTAGDPDVVVTAQRSVPMRRSDMTQNI